MKVWVGKYGPDHKGIEANYKDIAGFMLLHYSGDYGEINNACCGGFKCMSDTVMSIDQVKYAEVK